MNSKIPGSNSIMTLPGLAYVGCFARLWHCFSQYLNHCLTRGLQQCSKQFFALTTVVMAITLGCSTAIADDTELYSGLNNTPKVLLVLDVSGSMGWGDRGYQGTRLKRMQQALSLLLADLRDVDVGLMSYSGNAIQLLHPVADVVQNQAALQSIVNGLRAGGGTPTVSALNEAGLYMGGGVPYRGTEPNGQRRYQSPVTSECQSSHIVLLSDGDPYGDTQITTRLEQQFGQQCTREAYTSATCGVELATQLLANNQLPQTQWINPTTTHSIGFNLRSNWLTRVANAGGGVYKDAASSQELLTAFEDILDSVEIQSAGSAPSISINAFNESRHRDELYYSFFQPYRNPRWDGNVKKYRLHNGEIVDKDGLPVLDDDGNVAATSRSFWSSHDDGENVADGGMAAKQPAGRKWYTDAGVAPTNGVITPYLVTRANAPSASALGAANNNERNSLLNWVRGYDLEDTSAANNYVADSLHNSPMLVTYKARKSDGLLEEAIFTANNMGVLHAVNADTGEELWSYSPAELLPNIKKYVDNRSNSHVYGLDGNIVVHSVNKTSSSDNYEIDKAWLYMTQRRGGKSIFALDVSKAMNSTTEPLKVMWKITGGIANTDFRDLGQTWATPQMIPIKYGCPDACKIKEVLMFGGGYNPVYDDKALSFPVSPAATGHGNAIYMVDPETGELLWSAGNGSHHTLDLPMNDSIPTTPVPVDTNADGAVDILFSSDIAGNVWRIDLRKNAETLDKLAVGSRNVGGGKIASLNETGQTLRFFNRIDAVISGTTEGTAHFNLVLGSGMRSSPLYDELVDNRIFVFKDPWVFSYPPGEDVDRTTGELIPRYDYVKNTNGTYALIRPRDLWQHGTRNTGDSLRYGYYRVFDERAEKILQPTLTHSGRVFVVSYVPPDPTIRYDSCSYNLGESRLHVMDLADGSNVLPANFGLHKVIGAGIISIGSIIDTGDGSGPDFVTGLTSEKLIDLLGPTDTNNFRRFIRTGWLEKDDH